MNKKYGDKELIYICGSNETIIWIEYSARDVGNIISNVSVIRYLKLINISCRDEGVNSDWTNLHFLKHLVEWLHNNHFTHDFTHCKINWFQARSWLKVSCQIWKKSIVALLSMRLQGYSFKNTSWILRRGPKWLLIIEFCMHDSGPNLI